MLFLLAGLAFIGLAKAQSCPEPYGVQTYPNEQYCDKFYKVQNILNFSILQTIFMYLTKGPTVYLLYLRQISVKT